MSNTDLQEIIWQVVAAIPLGKVASYGQVAKIAGFPSHARFVGYTLRNLPKGTTLPWYRVVNAQGKIAFPKDSEAYKRQRALLEAEGVVFVNGKISFSSFGWN